MLLLSAGLALSADPSQPPLPPPAPAGQKIWTFDKDPPGQPPENFVVGTLFDGRPAGSWHVLVADDPLSPPSVLAQLEDKGAEHAYKVVLVNDSEATDFELEVSFYAVRGKGDMGGGIIWRARDDRNYYLLRANPIEQNIRLYRVVKGVRHQLENFDRPIEIKKWHSLKVVTDGCKVQAYFDGKPVMFLCDRTFTKGRIGLWTKSDAVTYFDNLKLLPVK